MSKTETQSQRDRRVNAVVKVLIPLDVSSNAPRMEQRDAAVEAFEKHVTLSDECAAMINTEIVTDDR